MTTSHSARLACLLAITAQLAGAQQPDTARATLDFVATSRPTVRASLAGSPIRVDGKLDDRAWAEAQAFSAFRQRDPQEGAPASERTEVRVVYDASAIYIGARMFDRDPSLIRARLGRRDEPLEAADLVEFYFDPFHDRLGGVVFRITPAGAIRDATVNENGGQDNSWDAVWESAAVIDSLGWAVELRIPFSQLRFNVGEADTTWGFQVGRIISRKAETQVLAFAPKRARGGPEIWADLTGLRDLPRARHLELRPYITARGEHLHIAPGNPFRGDRDYEANAGIDVKYGLTNSLTLSGTVNPDFGQVEVDPVQINLSANELFFSERRPFFVEGADVFRFARIRGFNFAGYPTILHSRRIGRAPQRSVASAYPFVDAPEEVTIAGAVKVAGKVRGGISLGVLDAVTTREDARFQKADGTRAKTSVEPMTNYFVGRARKDANNGNTGLGLNVTAVNRDLSDSALKVLLRRDAYFAGVDLNQSWKQREWSLDAAYGVSYVGGSKSAITSTQRSSVRYMQRPDRVRQRLDTNRNHLAGTAWTVSGAKNSGEHWIGNVAYQEVTPGFEVNDLGFHTIAGWRNLASTVAYKDDTPGKYLRNYIVGPYTTHIWNWDGQNAINDIGFIFSDVVLSNFWGAFARIEGAPEGLDGRLTRGGPTAARPRRIEWEVGLSTDGRKPYRGEFFYEHEEDAGGGWRDAYSTELSWRPRPELRLSFEPYFENRTFAAQFITQVADASANGTYGRRYVIGSLRYNELGLETRVDWTFSPTLSLQMFLQPLVAAGRFSDFKSLARTRTFEFDRFRESDGTLTKDADGFVARPPGGPAIRIGFPDFNTHSLIGNAIVRWEYRPGSALFFVWQQRRAGDDGQRDFAPGRDVGAIFRERPENIFAVKATYWIGR